MDNPEKGSGLTMMLERSNEIGADRKFVGKSIRKNGYGRDGHLKIIELYSSPSGLPSAIDIVNNKLILLGPGGVVGEAIGIPKAGRSERLKDAAVRLINDEKIQDVLGRKLIVTILKPNSLAKNLFEKDPQKRAHYNEYICNLHRNTLIELTSFNPRPNVDFVYTDVALFDRGPYDDIFWSYALKEADLIDDIEKDDALKISARSVRDKLIDIVFGINVPPATSLRREEKRGEGYGNVMNPEFLPIIHAIYMKAEREEKLRIGLFSLYKEGRITESDYSDQTKGFLIRQTRYISVNGEDSKEINSDKFFNPLKGQLLYNHGVSEELEHLLEKSA